jgi:hypothetical protein
MVMSDTASWITFGKERYWQHPDMEQWCHEHVGTGGWSYQTPETWEGMNGKIWVMHSMFGNTTFAFKDAKHLTMFLLRWL